MKLSTILAEMKICDYIIYNESEFDNLSLLLPGRNETNRCVFLMEKKYIKKIDSSVSMVVTTENLVDNLSKLGVGICVVEAPRLVFYQIHNYLSTKEWYKPKLFKTQIGENTYIAPTAVVPENNIMLGKNVIIEEHVVLIGHVEIGDNTIIHTGSVVGALGNDFKRYGEHIVRTAQVGKVRIGSNVEIDPNCCIERPAFPYEKTEIGDESKIGALSFLAHGIRVGRRTQLKGMVNVAGYVVIGDDVFVGPGVTISNLVTIGNNSNITIGSVVGSSIQAGAHVTGNFAIDHDKFMVNQLNKLR